LAAEYLGKKHGIEVSKETVRKWMIGGKLWRAKKEKVRQIHTWRPRRRRFGELVQWDTSEHDWLEGRGEKLYLIAMIDDATGRLFARFVRHDSTEENMRLLWNYLEKFGRPRFMPTTRACFKRRRSANAMSQQWTRTRGRCRRRSSGGRCASWGSSGSRPILPNPGGNRKSDHRRTKDPGRP
jgi:transposase-like protein